MPLTYHKKRKLLLSSTRSHHRLSHPSFPHSSTSSTSSTPSFSHPSHPSTSSLPHPSHPSPSPSTPLLPSTQARSLIRTHHILQKRLAAARAAHDPSLIASFEAQIATLGGLAQYQRASFSGQAKTRGGDSSDVLVRWIWEMMMVMEDGGGEGSGGGNGEGNGKGKRGRRRRESGKRHECEKGWRMLEVGALRVDNAAARSGLFTSVERIDLHAQEKGILTQDFMQRPFPARNNDADDDDDENENENETFDVISLSLVLNYIGDPSARGQMLRRVEKFLRKPKRQGAKNNLPRPDTNNNNNRPSSSSPSSIPPFPFPFPFPGLFLVLPAPCVTNSRYMDEDRLEAMMRGLGYVRAKRKLSGKLVYYFWAWVGGGERGREGVGEGGGPDGPDGDEKEEEEEEDKDEGAEGERVRKQAIKKPKQEIKSKGPHWPKVELAHRKGARRNNFAVVFK